jgi:putative component of membrane protein insertase Oxa1/YidC/SpoIIIJ protein YidD
LAWGALAAIAVYQRVIPDDKKPECLFTPSCSQYMSLAIRRYGVRRGVERGRLRLARCVGFVGGGEDWP